ncbi:DUF3667 domain-containing protein [Gilvibacter sediminis]|uniref:DUF3667 domain-containing protein n=1 Tax=Gilvibacter sediminis TaxID=379071 RepID=UPI00234FD909|nr:DUF3667 domain-containing protein [Gilvibacter sediminis]MDC7999394.1 DUF3667 domain-containing protein [Gilvibacter sediminis]
MNCKNCDETLEHGAQFCNHCGARVIVEPFTFKYVTQDFEERFLNLDRNLLVRTFRDMLLRPKAVIDGYIDGVRKRHMNLANWLAVAITASGLMIFVIRNLYPESLDMTWMVEAMGESQKDNPFFQNLEQEDPTETMWWMEYQAILYILMIPIYALLAKITFIKQKAYSYLKHIVIVGYTQSWLSLAMTLPVLILLPFGANYMKMSYWVILIQFLFSAYVYKRMFNLSFLGIVWRSLLFILIGIGVYLLLVIGVVIFMMVFGAGFAAQG